MTVRPPKKSLLYLRCGLAFLWWLSLSSCYGRRDDLPTTDRKGGNLRQATPKLLAFGAGWCKPCRKEVSYLNQLVHTYGQALTLTAYLVEGDTPGSEPTEKVIAGFVDPEGKRDYELLPDHNWDIMKSYAPAQGQQLPFLVFIDGHNQVVGKLQRSPGSYAELNELLQKYLGADLTEGSKDDDAKGENPSTPSALVNLALPSPYAAWHVLLSPSQLSSLQQSWQKTLGLAEWPGTSGIEQAYLIDVNMTADQTTFYAEMPDPAKAGRFCFAKATIRGLQESVGWSSRCDAMSRFAISDTLASLSLPHKATTWIAYYDLAMQENVQRVWRQTCATWWNPDDFPFTKVWVIAFDKATQQTTYYAEKPDGSPYGTVCFVKAILNEAASVIATDTACMAQPILGGLEHGVSDP